MDRYQKRVLRLRDHVLKNKREPGERGNGTEELDGLTVKELKEKAKGKGIEGYSSLTKEELVEALVGD